MDLLFWVGLVPLVGVLLLPFVVETKDRALALAARPPGVTPDRH